MSFTLLFLLNKYGDYLDYNFDYKAVYILIIVGIVAVIYLVSCLFVRFIKN